jgi:choline-sulfatase
VRLKAVAASELHYTRPRQRFRILTESAADINPGSTLKASKRTEFSGRIESTRPCGTLDGVKIYGLFLCSFLVPATVFADDASPALASRRNVYLITIDTLRSDHVGCYGYERIQTPAMDQLAKEGIRFAQAFTPSPITNTSHVSILTGLLPTSHGVSDFGVPLAAAHPTLPELLQKQGYRTAAFIGAVILDSKTLAPGLDRGFEFYDNFSQQPPTKSRWGRLERRGMEVVQHAEDWLDSHIKAEPHFVWVHLYDPHDPYEPPPPYSEKYRDRLYDGEIAYADSALGHFLTYLKKKNWYDGALIILVGDHGEGLGEHGEDTHGIFLYDSTTHVPLLVKLPEEKEAGKVVAGQVRTIDVMPTVLDLLTIAAAPGLDGTSLLHIIFGSEAPRTALGETDYPVRFGWAPLRSIRREGFKFIEAPRPELFDLESDPGETRNRYVPWDPLSQKLRKILSELRAKSPSTGERSAGAVGAGTVSELRALGYLDASDERSSTDVPEPSLLPDPKDKVEQQNLLHAAMLAAEDGRPADARASLQKLLEVEHDYPIALRQLGQLEMDSGNYAKAAQSLKRLCEVRPGDAVAALDYARALNLNGNLLGARAALQKSLKLKPNQLDARLLLGRVDLSSNEYKSAEDEFESALLLKPASEEGQIGLAKALLGQKKFADAVGLLEASTSSGTTNAELFELLAQAYRATGKTAPAKNAEEQAERLRSVNGPH